MWICVLAAGGLLKGKLGGRARSPSVDTALIIGPFGVTLQPVPHWLSWNPVHIFVCLVLRANGWNLRSAVRFRRFLPQVLHHSLGIQKLAVVPALKCAWSRGGGRCWCHTGAPGRAALLAESGWGGVIVMVFEPGFRGGVVCQAAWLSWGRKALTQRIGGGVTCM